MVETVEEMETSNARVLAGCCGFPAARTHYYRRLPLVEVQETFFMPPRSATLQRWREQAPPGFVFTIKAWQLITHEPDARGYRRVPKSLEIDTGQCGHFRLSDAVLRAYEQTVACAAILGAPAIVFETPVSFTPTVMNRRYLTEFFERIPRHGRWMVWSPRGLWDEQEVRTICERLDLVHAADPVSHPQPLGERSYLRLQAARYSDEDLMRVADALQEVELAYCLFNTVSMYGDAQRLQAMVAEE